MLANIGLAGFSGLLLHLQGASEWVGFCSGHVCQPIGEEEEIQMVSELHWLMVKEESCPPKPYPYLLIWPVIKAKTIAPFAMTKKCFYLSKLW